MNLPTGTLYGPHAGVHRAGDRPARRTPTAYRPLIVAYRNGAPVRLEELGRVIDSVENDKIASWFNDDARRSSWPIQRQPGTNTVEVVDAIKALLPQFRAQLPAVGEARRPLRPLASRSASRSTT